MLFLGFFHIKYTDGYYEKHKNSNRNTQMKIKNDFALIC